MKFLRRIESEDGFTVVELLSAMSVFAIVLASFAMVLSSAIRHSGEVEAQTNLQVEARSAIAFVSQDLRQVYDGDANVATSPIESIGPTHVQFLSPDRAQPFHLRRMRYQLNTGTKQFERALTSSTDTDGAPWAIPWSTPPAGSYRKLVGSVVNTAIFTFEKADGSTASVPLDVKKINIALTVATKTGPSRQYTYKSSVTVRGES